MYSQNAIDERSSSSSSSSLHHHHHQIESNQIK